MRRFTACFVLFAFAAALVVPGQASAQRPKSTTPIPKPRPVKLRTKDGVELSGFYFASNKGKDAIPVLLVHEWEGEKAPYGSLCLKLQAAGCAVLAFDYRGHGRSREVTNAAGETDTLNLQTISKREIGAIVQYDIEQAKKFLQEENNEEKLNLNALVVIGVREGCVLAAGFAQRDWQFPNVGSRKQGRDVKALVLISPERLLKGIPIEPYLTDRNVAMLPTMMIVGRGAEEESDTVRIHKRLGAMKRRFTGGKEAEGLTLLTVTEPFGGPVLVNKSAKVIPEIVKFVTSEVQISDVDNPWIARQ